MIQKTGSKRQGMSHGIQKSIRGRGPAEWEDEESSLLVLLLKKARCDWLIGKGSMCLAFIRKVPGPWCILPVVRVDTDRFAVSSSYIRRAVNIVLMALIISLAISRFAVVTHDMLNETLASVKALLCIGGLMIMWGCCFLALPCILKPHEAVDLLNASEQILDYVGHNFGHRVSYLNSAALCLQVIILLGNILLLPIESVVAIILFGPLPTEMFSFAWNLGCIPSINIPHILWRLLFCLLEYSIYLYLGLAAAFSIHVIMIGVATTKCYLNTINRYSDFKNIVIWCKFDNFNTSRELCVTDAESRRELEKLYITMQVYNKVLTKYVKFFLPLTIFTVSCAVILAIYITIRGRELPFLLYCIFPVAGASIIGLCNLNCMEIVKIKICSENIVSTLQSSTPPCLQQMMYIERLAALKRAKSMRPASFPVGDYGEVSYSLAVNTWEEVLDQLLLLLSL